MSYKDKPYKDKTRYFPFSPGIPWRTNKGYIKPNVDFNIWEGVVGNRDLVFLSSGGFIETFFSLSLIEAYTKIFPEKNRFWLGNSVFSDLVSCQGLAGLFPENLNENIANSYPVPLFVDKENHSYINCLNNYITKKTFDLKREEENKDPLLKQIFDNSLIGEWDNKYIPKLRYLNKYSNNYFKWKKENNFSNLRRYVVIIDNDLYSVHSKDCLGWEERQIRALAAMLRHLDLPVIVCSDDMMNRSHNLLTFSNADIFSMINLIIDSWMVLSSNIDFLLLSLMCSDAIIMSKIIEGAFNIDINSDYLGSDNIVLESNDLTVNEVFESIKAINAG